MPKSVNNIFPSQRNPQSFPRCFCAWKYSYCWTISWQILCAKALKYNGWSWLALRMFRSCQGLIRDLSANTSNITFEVPLETKWWQSGLISHKHSQLHNMPFTNVNDELAERSLTSPLAGTKHTYIGLTIIIHCKIVALFQLHYIIAFWKPSSNRQSQKCRFDFLLWTENILKVKLFEKHNITPFMLFPCSNFIQPRLLNDWC